MAAAKEQASGMEPTRTEPNMTEQPTPRQQFIDAVREATDLEGVAANYGRVTHQGFRALTPCPCHDDAMLTFIIDPGQQTGRCWSCLAEGDAIWFVMASEDICFRDAVRKLASTAEIEEPANIEWLPVDTQRPRTTTTAQAESYISLRSLDGPRRLRV